MSKKETYEQFVDKFMPKRTTDDCYTPKPVYDAVVTWAEENLGIRGRQIVRPFFPGGDYQHHDYPEGCVVIDNPPFSIYSQIVRFYLQRGISFLLFAPALTQLVVDADVCYLATSCNITYENGAQVRTSFTTNLMPGVRMWTAPSLRSVVNDAAEEYLRTKRRELYKIRKPGASKKYRWPDHLISSATIGKISTRGIDYLIKADECTYIRKASGITLFGASLLLTRSAAAEKAAAEKAAAEKAAAEELITLQVEPYENIKRLKN